MKLFENALKINNAFFVQMDVPELSRVSLIKLVPCVNHRWPTCSLNLKSSFPMRAQHESERRLISEADDVHFFMQALRLVTNFKPGTHGDGVSWSCGLPEPAVALHR
jgi:hypothetical protein